MINAKTEQKNRSPHHKQKKKYYDSIKMLKKNYFQS